ncbi:MAG: hypothetical protein ACLPYZ_11655, partial [Limisphaerales bacterium]
PACGFWRLSSRHFRTDGTRDKNVPQTRRQECLRYMKDGTALAPGFSLVMMVEKRREAVLTALVCREPVETGFILGTTGFTEAGC